MKKNSRSKPAKRKPVDKEVTLQELSDRLIDLEEEVNAPKKWDVQSCIGNLFNDIKELEDTIDGMNLRITDLEAKVLGQDEEEEETSTWVEKYILYAVRGRSEQKRKAKYKVLYFRGKPIKTGGWVKWWTPDLSEAHVYNDLGTACEVRSHQSPPEGYKIPEASPAPLSSTPGYEDDEEGYEDDEEEYTGKFVIAARHVHRGKAVKCRCTVSYFAGQAPDAVKDVGVGVIYNWVPDRDNALQFSTHHAATYAMNGINEDSGDAVRLPHGPEVELSVEMVPGSEQEPDDDEEDD